MPILDDDGRLFGVVNIIDALVVLLVLAVVAAGAALVLGPDEPASPASNNNTTTTPAANETMTENMTIVYRLENVPRYMIDPIEEGPVPASPSLVTVEEVAILESDNDTVTAELTVETTVTRENELTYYNGNRIYVGKTVTLDFGDVVVKPTVVRFA
ncbi:MULTISPECIES: DUF4330 family protein [unclassified Haladaptatus]|uniref:DUF4330 family protein n=1 Tax=unclassified Haladaptatus TaxID=2622732 RepID=UPI0023E8DFEE|nr:MULTISPECIES: DUF4330 family protein [unclassified Haladaptatus]